MQVSLAIRSLFGIAVIGAAAMASTPAMALTGNFSPGGAVTATGYFAITKGTTTWWNCKMVANINFSGAVFNGSAAGTTFTVSPAENIGTVNSVTLMPGSLLCMVETEQALPWTIQVTGGTYPGSLPATADTVNLTLVNTDFHNSSIGDCVGSLSGTFNPATSKLTIQATVMTGIYPVDYCHFHGPGTSDNANPVVLTISPSQTVPLTP